jgi:hypothetical protein
MLLKKPIALSPSFPGFASAQRPTSLSESLAVRSEQACILKQRYYEAAKGRSSCLQAWGLLQLPVNWSLAGAGGGEVISQLQERGDFVCGSRSELQHAKERGPADSASQRRWLIAERHNDWYGI